MNGDATDIEWIRASASIPIVSKPVKLDGYELLDGGVSDSIPVNWMLERSTKTVVVLTRDKSYRKEPMKYIKLLKRAFKEYPNLTKALENRYIVYNKTLDQIEQLEREGKVFVIRPSKPIACAMIEKDPNHLQEIYDIGRRDALHYLEDLKNICEVFHILNRDIFIKIFRSDHNEYFKKTRTHSVNDYDCISCGLSVSCSYV